MQNLFFSSRLARPAFTLVELLAVIAIIALMAAILFPVFARAREKARQSACASNLKQLGMAAALYIGDADDRYPLGHAPVDDPLTTFDGGGDYEPHFIELLRPYIRNQKNQGVWRCPTDPSKLYNIDSDGTEFHVSYAVNGAFEYGQSLSKVESPAAKVYVLESTDDDHFHWWNIGRSKSGDSYLAYNALPPDTFTSATTNRHSGGANYLYADGHVKWATFSSLWGTTQNSNAFWP